MSDVWTTQLHRVWKCGSTVRVKKTKDYVPLGGCSGVWKELPPSIYVFDAPTVLSSNHRECICDVVTSMMSRQFSHCSNCRCIKGEMHATVHVINVTRASHYCDRVETITGLRTLFVCSRLREKKKFMQLLVVQKKKFPRFIHNSLLTLLVGGTTLPTWNMWM